MPKTIEKWQDSLYYETHEEELEEISQFGQIR